MQLKNLLSPEEIEQYHEEWKNFSKKDKYLPETPYNVHSGLSVICNVFQYKDKPVFRTHVLKKQLKKIDPYHLGQGNYFYPYFHITHYFLPIEQLWHASLTKLHEDYPKFVCADIPDRKNPPRLNCPIDFRTGRTSVEIVFDLKFRKDKLRAKGTATYYDDKTNKELQMWPFEVFGRLREYVRRIEDLKQGNEKAKEQLIQKIECRQSRLKNPRENHPNKDYIINQLQSGEIPEEELHNFFSFWDRPE